MTLCIDSLDIFYLMFVSIVLHQRRACNLVHLDVPEMVKIIFFLQIIYDLL